MDAYLGKFRPQPYPPIHTHSHKTFSEYIHRISDLEFVVSMVGISHLGRLRNASLVLKRGKMSLAIVKQQHSSTRSAAYYNLGTDKMLCQSVAEHP